MSYLEFTNEEKKKLFLDIIKNHFNILVASVSSIFLAVSYFIYYQIEVYLLTKNKITTSYISFDIMNLLSVISVIIFYSVCFTFVVFLANSFNKKLYSTLSETIITMLLIVISGISYFKSEYFLMIPYYKNFLPFSSVILYIFTICLSFVLLLKSKSGTKVKIAAFVLAFIGFAIVFAPWYAFFIQSDTNYYVLENGLSCKLIRKYNNNAICKVEKDLYIKESVHILDLTKKEYVLEYTKKSSKDLFFEKLNKLRSDKNLSNIQENTFFAPTVKSLLYDKPCSTSVVSDSVQVKYNKDQLPNNKKGATYFTIRLYNLNLRYEDIDSFINKSEFFLNKDVEYFTKYITTDNNTVYVFILNLTPENEKELVDYVNSEEFKNLDCDKKE